MEMQKNKVHVRRFIRISLHAVQKAPRQGARIAPEKKSSPFMKKHFLRLEQNPVFSARDELLQIFCKLEIIYARSCHAIQYWHLIPTSLANGKFQIIPHFEKFIAPVSHSFFENVPLLQNTRIFSNRKRGLVPAFAEILIIWDVF